MQIEIQCAVDEETAAAIGAALVLFLRPEPVVAPVTRTHQPAWARAGILENHAAQQAIRTALQKQHFGEAMNVD